MPVAAYYNASKAAVRQYGETLRLELAPLGVKVVTAMVGFVGTKIMDNLPNFELPDNSLWKPASKAINSSISREGAPEATPPSVLARDVVNDVLGGANGLIWRGRQAGLARLASAIFPSWLFVSLHTFLDPMAAQSRYELIHTRRIVLLSPGVD